MAKKNEMDTYIKKSQKGDKDAYRKIIEFMYHEIYNLAAFIYDDEQTIEKMTKYLFIKAYKNISEYDFEECDIHLWMAREATKALYESLCESGENIFPDEIEQQDYDYDSIEDDDEFGVASAEFNEGFLMPDGFNAEYECFESLTAGEKIIYLLYCYEGYTVEETEEIMNVDAAYIVSEIAAMRDGVIAAYEECYDGIDIIDDESPEMEEKPVSSEKKYAIGSFRFTEKEFKGLIVGAFAVVVLIAVIVVVVIVSGHNNSSGDNTGSSSSTVKTTTQAVTTTAVQEETTTEEETTTAAQVPRGTQPDVEIKTTAAPATTTAPTTTAPTTTAAPATTTAAPATTTAAPATTTAAPATTTAAPATTTAAPASTTAASSSATAAQPATQSAEPVTQAAPENVRSVK